jgi:hypothetical protein
MASDKAIPEGPASGGGVVSLTVHAAASAAMASTKTRLM